MPKPDGNRRQTSLKLAQVMTTYCCEYCGPVFSTNLEIISALRCSLHGELLTSSVDNSGIFPNKKFRLESFSRKMKTAKKQA